MVASTGKTTEGMTEETGSTGAPERCIRQPALSAARNAKFLSSPPKAGLFIAGTASPSEGDISSRNIWIVG